MECKPEESTVSEQQLQAESGAEALSAPQHTQVWEEASLLDAQLHVWTELGKMGSGEERISPVEEGKHNKV